MILKKVRNVVKVYLIKWDSTILVFPCLKNTKMLAMKNTNAEKAVQISQRERQREVAKVFDWKMKEEDSWMVFLLKGIC